MSSLLQKASVIFCLLPSRRDAIMVASDWIEDQDQITTLAEALRQTPNKVLTGNGNGNSYGNGNGSGDGDGDGDGNSYGSGDGNSYGSGNGNGYGDGDGNGSGYGDGSGSD